MCVCVCVCEVGIVRLGARLRFVFAAFFFSGERRERSVVRLGVVTGDDVAVFGGEGGGG